MHVTQIILLNYYPMLVEFQSSNTAGDKRRDAEQNLPLDDNSGKLEYGHHIF